MATDLIGAKATPFSPTNEGRLSRAVGAVREPEVARLGNGASSLATPFIERFQFARRLASDYTFPLRPFRDGDHLSGESR